MSLHNDHQKGLLITAIGGLTLTVDIPLIRLADGSAWSILLLRTGTTILVPINGTEVSRRAADFALALARPHRARVKVLYVSQAARGGGRTDSVSHRREEAVLKDIANLADRYGVAVDTAIRARATPDRAIVREMTKGAAMVVMGVTQRPGDDLFFGDTAAAVLAGSTGPVVLLASERAPRNGEVPDDETG